MPLPDERPRASVANLIGRFEQQNKRHSLSTASNASPSRSSSVVSNITGDSAKEEVKEKREWPPKSAVVPDNSSPLAPPAPIYASAFWSKAKPAAAADPPSTTSSDASKSTSNVSSPPTAKPESTVEAAVFIETPYSPTPQPHVVATAAQSPRVAKSAARTTAKPAATPRFSMPPIKFQHTGQSTTSTTSTSLSKPKVAPSTPKTSRSSGIPGTPSSVRPKTPSHAAVGRPKTPAIHANRPKTPSSSTPTGRPKTPSSGLFAPTAASLARARNGPPQLQAPTRKVTLSSAAAERLSKPTAASLSKARSAPSTTPIKISTTSGKGVSAGAKAVVKRKAPSGSPRKGATAERIERGAPPTNGNGKVSHEETEGNAASVEEVLPTDELPETQEEDVDEEVLVEDNESEMHESKVHIKLHEDGKLSPESEAHSGAEELSPSERESITQSVPSPTPSADHLDESSLDHNANSPAGEGEAILPLGEEADKLPQEEGNDIEDIVNLLEFSKPRPISMVSIPNELDVHEIPDEE